MNRYATLTIAMLLASASPVFAQSIPLKISSPSPSPAAEAAQTVTGRIIRLDLKAGTFAVKAFGSKKEVQLKAGEGIDVQRLRRGQRVVITYSNGIATKLVATRSTQ